MFPFRPVTYTFFGVFCVSLLFIWPSNAMLGIYDVRDFGAVGDGTTVDTSAVQEAIDTCAREGGGTVVFPRGRYLSGTLFMKSKVTLRLEKEAVLLGSTRVEDYPLQRNDFPSYTDRYCARALLWGEGLEDIGIVGEGTIDGRGEAFLDDKISDEEAAKLVSDWPSSDRFTPKGVYINRPYILRFVSCRNVRVQGITMVNSAMWMQHYLNCDFVRIEGITVYNHCNSNNDMIDIDSCRDVVISDCIGDSDDDALTLKSTSNHPTERVTIANCILSSHCNALKMGTESLGGFKDITISNCVIRPSRDKKAMAGRDEGLAGIALEIVDGGSMERITITNITVLGETTPLFVRLGNRARPMTNGGERFPVGTLRDVVVSNLVAEGAGRMPCSIVGIPDHPIENVVLSNIRILSPGGGTLIDSEVEVPEKEDKYPECTMFGTLPAYGFYCRHVEGLTLENILVEFENKDERPPYYFEDVKDLFISHAGGETTESTPGEVVLDDCGGVRIQSCRSEAKTVFLAMRNETKDVILMGNDLRRVGTPVERDETVPETAFEKRMNLGL